MNYFKIDSKINLNEFMKNEVVCDVITTKMAALFNAIETLNEISNSKLIIGDFIDNIPEHILLRILMKHVMNDDKTVEQFLKKVDAERKTNIKIGET